QLASERPHPAVPRAKARVAGVRLDERSPRRPVAHGGDRHRLIARTGAVGELPEPEEPRAPTFLDERPPFATDRVAELVHFAADDLVYLVEIDHGARHSGGAMRAARRGVFSPLRFDFAAAARGVRCFAARAVDAARGTSVAQLRRMPESTRSLIR